MVLTHHQGRVGWAHPLHKPVAYLLCRPPRSHPPSHHTPLQGSWVYHPRSAR